MTERALVAGMFRSILRFDANCGQLAADIERGCYAATREDCPGEAIWTDRFKASYSAIAYRVSSALTSGALAARLINGEVDAAKLAFMTSDELDPSANEAIRAEIALRSVQKIERSICTMYTCSRCGKSETDGGYEQQRRAADEGTSLTIQCLVPGCGNKWRIG